MPAGVGGVLGRVASLASWAAVVVAVMVVLPVALPPLLGARWDLIEIGNQLPNQVK